YHPFAVFIKVFPAEIAFSWVSIRRLDAYRRGIAAAFAGQTYTRQAFAIGKRKAAVDVVPGLAFIALHHGELDAVDKQQLFQCQAEFLGDKDVDFDQSHAAGVITTQGAASGPGA